MSQDFRTTLTIHSNTAACYRALTQEIPLWWSRSFEGRSGAVGDTFTVRFGDTHKTFTVEALETENHVAWLCTDSHLDLATLDNKSEWNGTRIVWKLTPMNQGLQLDVRHEGLTPQIGCYDACVQGWNHFLGKSLAAYLETGQGAPF